MPATGGGAAPSIEVLRIGDGKDIALVMSLTRNALPKVQEYLHRALPQVGTVVHVTPSGAAAQVSVAGGEHALSIAALAGQAVSDLAQPGDRTHVFISAPNAVSFFLGQQADSMGVCIPYEFDLKKKSTPLLDLGLTQPDEMGHEAACQLVAIIVRIEESDSEHGYFGHGFENLSA